MILEHLIYSAPAHVLTLATPRYPRPTPSHPAPPTPAAIDPTLQMFDEDKSGRIDEDEFFFLLQYLGIEVGTAVVRFCR